MDPSAFGGAAVKSNAAEARAKFLARKAQGGGSAPANPFASRAAFGAAAAPAFGGSSVFGAAAGGGTGGTGAFGKSASVGFASSAATGGVSAFGKSASAGFGAGLTQSGGSGGGIGGGIGAGIAPAVTGFGKPSIFGQKPAGAVGGFGQAGRKPAAGPFGAGAAGPAAFGGAAPKAAGAGGMFGGAAAGAPFGKAKPAAAAAFGQAAPKAAAGAFGAAAGQRKGKAPATGSPARVGRPNPNPAAPRLSVQKVQQKAGQQLGKLSVTNLPPDKNNDAQLKQYFAQYGEIVGTKCFPQKNGALVMFKTLEHAQQAKRHAGGYHKLARCRAEPYDPNARKGATTSAATAAKAPQAAVSGAEKRTEKRVDASDGGSYTKAEFVELYGGTVEWDAAAPVASSLPATAQATGKPQPKTSVLARLGGMSSGGAERSKEQRREQQRSAVAAPARSNPEKRVDASDGGSYTKAEFVELYGGTVEWDAAAPKTAAAAATLPAAPAVFTFGSSGVERAREPAQRDDEAPARAAALADAPKFAGRLPSPKKRVVAPVRAQRAAQRGTEGEVGRPDPPAHTFVQDVDNVTVGTCCEMCPEEEVQYVNGELNHKWSSQPGKVGYDLLPCFEGSEMKTVSGAPLKHGLFAGEGPFRGQPLRPVKRWRRAAAGVDMPAHELRTPEALIMSLSYICSDVVVDRTIETVDKALQEEYTRWIQRDPPKAAGGGDRTSFDEDQLKLDVYCYASEKVQQIGKDVIGQALISWEAVEVREQASRFYIMYNHELCDDPYWERTAPQYVMKNDLELDAVLGDTNDVHKKMRGRGFHCPNEGEFACYLLLRSMDPTKVMKMPSDVRTSAEVLFAMQVMEAYKTGDYVTFFRMLRDEATFLQGCLMLNKVSEVRQQGLRILNKTMGTAKLAKTPSTRVPLEEIVRLFAFDDAMDAAEFCAALGYQVREGAVWMKEELTPETDNLAKYQELKTGKWYMVKMQAMESKKHTKLQCIMRGSSDYARPIGDAPGQAASPRQHRPAAVAMPSKEEIATQAAKRQEMEKLKAAIAEKERLKQLRKQEEQAKALARRQEEERAAEVVRQEAERARRAEEAEEARTRAEAEAAARAAEEERQRRLAAQAEQRRLEAEAKERDRLRILAEEERKRREAEEQRLAQIERERKAECVRLLKKSLRWWIVCAKLTRWKRERLEAIEKRKRHVLGRWAMLGWLKRWRAAVQNLISIRAARVAESQKFYEGLHRKSGSGKEGSYLKRGRLDSKYLVGKTKVARYGSIPASLRVETIKPLNVVDIVADTLAAKDPQARALLWQLVVAADDEHRTYSGQDGWLHAKLTQPQPDCSHATRTSDDTKKYLSLRQLASLRVPGRRSRLLSLYQETLSRPDAETSAQRASSLSLCCLSLDASSIQQECGEAAEDASPLRQELKGTAGIIFLATVRSDTELEWARHRQRLRLLMATVPKTASVPVLILVATDVYPCFPDGHVHRVLGLNDGFFSGRVAAFLYHVVRETPNEETHQDFERCLVWLASQSPVQPVVKEYELEALVQDSVAHWQDRASWQHQPVARPAAVLASLNEALDMLQASLDVADPTSIWWPSAEFEVLWNAVDDGSCGPEEIPLTDWNAPELWAEMRGAVDDMLSGLRFPEVAPAAAARRGTGGAGPLLAITAGATNSVGTAGPVELEADCKDLADVRDEEDESHSRFLAQLLQKLGYFRSRRRQHGAGGLAREQQADDELDTALGMPSGSELVELVDSVREAVNPNHHRHTAAGRGKSAGGDRELADMEWRLLVERLHIRRLDWLAATIEEQGLPVRFRPFSLGHLPHCFACSSHPTCCCCDLRLSRFHRNELS